ncbi:uncharacterized protein DNG_06051 [Cephalotrichum gorgonifer]|uniref:Transcription factor CBF/NF-Y/archaeal histone domain-containing protein n=1 Tax=Cephalotrichum gorgonifer TaxID=2041049 RepID=A0AAE8N1I8_9PEZI|nr:uncharacterized protein DNG_06051 [Cephalotrichum gorgonifer]
MAPGQKSYPRATVKKIVKAHSNLNISKNADILIFLDYALFMQTYESRLRSSEGVYILVGSVWLTFRLRLVKEAAIEAKKSGERGLTPQSVKKATPDALAKFNG